ncbi:large neutral amino acids transporter small subunit 1-like [Anneissia japonica]|uniref:large neutral amino acids transporter small subunit 1-like n=1 Tax=Anneissia japonica TaxID=1529436 RepID=UPI001425AD2B|nr:large neutral amino acids transporter small subunit 1-like [Anneissia japonica]
MSSSNGETTVRIKPRLGFFNGVCVNVGIIIGSGIFLSPKGIFESINSVGMSLIVWILCGAFSAIGAICFAELGLALPLYGGTYVYIREAFGSLLGFLYQWTSIVILIPSSTAIIALTFAEYVLQPFFTTVCPIPPVCIKLLGLIGVVTMTYINCISVRSATRMQDALTVAKIIALLIITITGFVNLIKVGGVGSFENSFSDISWKGLGAAFYSGLWSYSGWNCLNFMTEEMKNPKRDLPRAIVAGLFICVVIYILTNVAYFSVLTTDEILISNAVAVTFGEKALAQFAWIIPVSVALSTLGSINGTLLAISRLYFAGARDGMLPSIIAMINLRFKTPLPSLLITCITTLVYVFVEDVWMLINFFSFVEWSSSGLAVAALLYMRSQRPDIVKPLKVNLALPIIFVVSCIALVILGAISDPLDTLIGFIITLSGIPVYYLTIHKRISCISTLSKHTTHFLQKILRVAGEDVGKQEKIET